MKVLMIGPFPPVLNGVTVSNSFLYSSLEKNGWEVESINTETGKIASLQGDKISLFKIFTFLSIYKYIFKIHGKNIIYITSGQTFWGLVKYMPFMLYARLLSIPYVLHIHGGGMCNLYNDMLPYKQAIVRFLINRSASVITLSQILATEFKDTFPMSNVCVVENCYDPQLVSHPIKRQEHSIPRFIFLSNLMVGKGILEFLDALIILKNEKGIVFELAIAGNIEKGIGDVLDQKIKQLKGSIHFFGVADFQKKKELLYWSDVFVLPTCYIMEGQPISIIEAYVTGNIVLSTHQGGIKDIAGYDSFVKVESQNVPNLVETITSVISNQHTYTTATTLEKTQKRFASELFIVKISDLFRLLIQH